MSISVTAGIDPDAPMIDINTTPLIDVMLVLLIMFIITIPLQTHAVKVDLPQGIIDRPIVDPIRNKVVIDTADRILWNGTSIDLPTLARTLEATKTVAPQPELHLQPEALARYERVDEVLAVSKRVGITNLGFVGNEQYAAF